MTPYGRDALTALYRRGDGEERDEDSSDDDDEGGDAGRNGVSKNNSYRKRVKKELIELLRKAREQPIVAPESITPARFMEYLFSLWNSKSRHTGTRRTTGNAGNANSRVSRFYSRSYYEDSRSALYYLFGSHHHERDMHPFRQELNSYFQGFRRILAQQQPPSPHQRQEQIVSADTAIHISPTVSMDTPLVRSDEMVTQNRDSDWRRCPQQQQHLLPQEQQPQPDAAPSTGYGARRINTDHEGVPAEEQTMVDILNERSAFIQRELGVLRQRHQELLDRIPDYLSEALRQYPPREPDPDVLTEARAREMLDEFEESIRNTLDVYFASISAIAATTATPINTSTRAPPLEDEAYHIRTYCHHYDGKEHAVPKDWRLPKCGVHDLWRQWWLGDPSREVPPLQLLKNKDVCHLDDLPLVGDEKGPEPPRRPRAARKVMCDLRFIMEFVTKKIQETGALEERVINPTTVDRMFLSVSHLFSEEERDGRKQWTTAARRIRLKQPPKP